MNDIIEKIIEIDDKAKSIIKESKEKKNNIDSIIEENVSVKESVLEVNYKDIIKQKKNEYEFMLKEKEDIINQKNNWQIAKNEEDFYRKKDDLKKEILSKVIGIKK